MERREFIKNSLCLGCMGATTSWCIDIFSKYDLKNDKFYYRSKGDLPKIVRIDACSLCPLNCPECRTKKNLMILKNL